MPSLVIPGGMRLLSSSTEKDFKDVRQPLIRFDLYITDFHFRKSWSIGELQQLRSQNQVNSIPLLYESYPMAPGGARFLESLPQGRRRKTSATCQQPHLEQHGQDTFAELIAHVILDDRWRQKDLVDGQQKQQQCFPRFHRQDLRILGRVL